MIKVFRKPVCLLALLLAAILIVSGCTGTEPGRSKTETPSAAGGSESKGPAPTSEEKSQGPGSGTGGAETEKIVIGYPTVSMTWLPLKVAYEKGFLREEGLEVELIQMKANVAIAALTQGDADYITHFGSTMRNAIANNLPIRAVYASAGPMWSVVARKDITSIEQLKGKTAGVNAFGSSEDVFSRVTFKYYGLDPDKDLKYIALGEGSGRIAALEQGAIDVSLIPTPDDIRAEEKGFNILGRTAEATRSPIGGLGTTLDRINKNPEQVKKVIRGMLKGLKFIRENKDETVKIIAEWVNLTPEQASRAYDLVRDSYLDGVASDEDILLDPELTKAGLNKSNMDKVRDFSLVNEVKKEMGF